MRHGPQGQTLLELLESGPPPGSPAYIPPSFPIRRSLGQLEALRGYLILIKIAAATGMICYPYQCQWRIASIKQRCTTAQSTCGRNLAYCRSTRDAEDGPSIVCGRIL